MPCNQVSVVVPLGSLAYGVKTTRAVAIGVPLRIPLPQTLGKYPPVALLNRERYALGAAPTRMSESHSTRRLDNPMRVLLNATGTKKPHLAERSN